MSNPAERVQALEEMIETQGKHIRRGIKTVAWIYAILIIIVLAYTTYVYHFITGIVEEQTTEEQVIAYTRSWCATELPKHRETAVKKLREESDVWSKDLVAAVINMIPTLEQRLKGHTDMAITSMMVELNREVMPAFKKQLEASAMTVKQSWGDLSNEAFMKTISEMYFETMAKELDVYWDQHFVTELETFQKKLHNITAEGKAVTKKQDAQRRVLVSWAALSKGGDSGKSEVFAALLERVKNEMSQFLPAKPKQD
jgi:hypothetical protein